MSATDLTHEEEEVRSTTLRAYILYQVTGNKSTQANITQDSTEGKECEMRCSVSKIIGNGKIAGGFT